MSKTFVLMHGAWHGGWCWADVAAILRARGHHVTTPTQTGLGERRHLISREITLETFVQDLVNHLHAEDLSEVTLVGHSFGGNAVSGAAERCPERIRDLVYLDCTMIRGGDRPGDLITAGDLAARIASAGEAGGVGVPPPDVAVFGIADPDLAAQVQARLTPHPLYTFLSPLPISGAPGNGLPARYIACVEPQYHVPTRVRDWCAEFGLDLNEIATGHDAMITAPELLADMLDR